MGREKPRQNQANMPVFVYDLQSNADRSEPSGSKCLLLELKVNVQADNISKSLHEHE